LRVLSAEKVGALSDATHYQGRLAKKHALPSNSVLPSWVAKMQQRRCSDSLVLVTIAAVEQATGHFVSLFARADHDLLDVSICESNIARISLGVTRTS
jgi:hypothetical protein